MTKLDIFQNLGCFLSGDLVISPLMLLKTVVIVQKTCFISTYQWIILDNQLTVHHHITIVKIPWLIMLSVPLLFAYLLQNDDLYPYNNVCWDDFLYYLVVPSKHLCSPGDLDIYYSCFYVSLSILYPSSNTVSFTHKIHGQFHVNYQDIVSCTHETYWQGILTAVF